MLLRWHGCDDWTQNSKTRSPKNSDLDFMALYPRQKSTFACDVKFTFYLLCQCNSTLEFQDATLEFPNATLEFDSATLEFHNAT